MFLGLNLSILILAPNMRLNTLIKVSLLKDYTDSINNYLPL